MRTADGSSDLLDADVTDVELTRLALTADPDATVGADAVSFWEVAALEAGRVPDDQLLPEWYMPAMRGPRLLHGWRRRVVWLIVIAFLTIDAYGLCSTYGWVAFG
jgi:hypothetical protein